MTRSQSYAFMILHTLGTLMLPLLIALITGGCVKDDFKNDLGPPVPCSQVETAINGGIAGAYTKRDIGQWVIMRESYAPLSSNPTVTRDIVQSLVADVPHPKYDFARLITFVETIVTYAKDGKTTETKEYQTPIAAESFSCIDDPAISFHNLEVTDVTANSLDKNCSGNCKITVRKVIFDLAVDTGQEKERQHWMLDLSGDVPLLARELKRCRAMTTDINGQKVPITACLQVEEYGIATPTPTPTPSPSPSPSPSATPSPTP